LPPPTNEKLVAVDARVSSGRLLVVMMLLCTNSHQRILFGKDADDSRGGLVVNGSLAD
jgi:hypothetical protein